MNYISLELYNIVTFNIYINRLIKDNIKLLYYYFSTHYTLD